jgi:hypothetical protein
LELSKPHWSSQRQNLHAATNCVAH